MARAANAIAALFPRRLVLLAEAATDVALSHAHPARGDAEHPRADEPQLVRVLRGRPELQSILDGVPGGHDAARLHRRRVLAALAERGADHVGGAGEGVGERWLLAHGAMRHVGALLLVHDSDVGRRDLEVDHGRKRLELDVDQVAGVLGDVPVLGDNDRDRIADEAHGVRRQDRSGRPDDATADRRVERRVLEGREVLVREHGMDAGQRTGRGEVERDDPTVRDVAAHERRFQHARQRDVIDVATAPGEQAGVLLACHRLADESARVDRVRPVDRFHGQIQPPWVTSTARSSSAGTRVSYDARYGSVASPVA